MVKKNKKDVKITKKEFKNKREIVTDIICKKRKTQKENAKKINIRICLKKINKN